MVGALVRCKDVGMVGWLQHEIGASVLQRKAASFGDNAGAEASVIGINERDRVAVRVAASKVYSIGVIVGGRTVVWDGGGLGGIEEFCPFGEVGL